MKSLPVELLVKIFLQQDNQTLKKIKSSIPSYAIIFDPFFTASWYMFNNGPDAIYVALFDGETDCEVYRILLRFKECFIRWAFCDLWPYVKMCGAVEMVGGVRGIGSECRELVDQMVVFKKAEDYDGFKSMLEYTFERVEMEFDDLQQRNYVLIWVIDELFRNYGKKFSLWDIKFIFPLLLQYINDYDLYSFECLKRFCLQPLDLCTFYNIYDFKKFKLTLYEQETLLDILGRHQWIQNVNDLANIVFNIFDFIYTGDLKPMINVFFDFATKDSLINYLYIQLLDSWASNKDEQQWKYLLELEISTNSSYDLYLTESMAIKLLWKHQVSLQPFLDRNISTCYRNIREGKSQWRSLNVFFNNIKFAQTHNIPTFHTLTNQNIFYFHSRKLIPPLLDKTLSAAQKNDVDLTAEFNSLFNYSLFAREYDMMYMISLAEFYGIDVEESKEKARRYYQCKRYDVMYIEAILEGAADKLEMLKAKQGNWI